ncbi:hypothetical protein D3C75_809720 [compost metagenome]
MLLIGFAVFFTVDAQALLHVRSAFCTAEHSFGFADIESIQRPAGLKNDSRSVLHRNEADRRVLYREFLRVPRSPGIGGVLAAGQLMIGIAYSIFRFVIVHHP